MKKLLFLFLAMCAFVVSIVGAGITMQIGANAKTAGVIVQPGVNFNVLTNPIMAAACANNFYVIERDVTNMRIVTIERIGASTIGDTIATSTVMPIPLDIRVSGNFMFMFFETNFHVIPLGDLIVDGFTLVGAGHSYTLVNPTVFNVGQITSNRFVILYTAGHHFVAREIDMVPFVPIITPYESGNMPHNTQVINGIAYHSGTIYLFAAAQNTAGEFFFIFEFTGSAFITLHTGHFLSPSSFNVMTIPGSIGATFIVGGRLWFFDLNTGVTTFVNSADTNDFKVDLNYDPIYMFVRGPGEIFVIDAHKRSIDHYQLVIMQTGPVLSFVRAAVAHRGEGHGFFNRPTAMTIIGEDRLVVADFSDYIKLVDRYQEVTSNLIAQGDGQNVSVVRSMAFDNHQTIFLFDSMEGRIMRFNVGGTPIGNPITQFFTGATATNFGDVTQIFVNPSTQEVFALDAIHSALLRLDGNVFRQITIPFGITYNTRAAYSATHGVIYFINVQVAANYRHIAFNMATPATFVDLTTAFNLDFDARDIDVDILGDPIIIGHRTIGNQIVLSHFEVATLSPLSVSSTFIGGQVIASATLADSPSLNYDRQSNTLYWLGRNHAVEGVDLTLWTFDGLEGLDWRNDNPLNYPHTPLFATVNVGAQPLLFNYPASVDSIMRLNPQTPLMILEHHATFGTRTFNNYALVMFQNRTSVRHYVGYINRTFLNFTYQYYQDQYVFGPNAPRPTTVTDYSGRVILNGVRIFKYPTSAGLVPNDDGLTFRWLHIGAVTKNWNSGNRDNRDIPHHVTGLHILRRIVVRDPVNTNLTGDVRGMEFFMVRVTATGAPNPVAPFVGFVYVGHVINYWEPPSLPPLNANARVTLPSGMNPRVAQVYSDAAGINALEGEYLTHLQRIQVIGRVDRTRQFTRVFFWDAELQMTMPGYIETRFISSDGLSTWQLFGILLAAAGAILVVIFVIKHYRNKKSQV